MTMQVNYSSVIGLHFSRFLLPIRRSIVIDSETLVLYCVVSDQFLSVYVVAQKFETSEKYTSRKLHKYALPRSVTQKSRSFSSKKLQSLKTIRKVTEPAETRDPRLDIATSHELRIT